MDSLGSPVVQPKSSCSGLQVLPPAISSSASKKVSLLCPSYTGPATSTGGGGGVGGSGSAASPGPVKKVSLLTPVDDLGSVQVLSFIGWMIGTFENSFKFSKGGRGDLVTSVNFEATFIHTYSNGLDESHMLVAGFIINPTA